MRITHINYSDISGGAARAAYRLYLGLKKIGNESHMLVKDKKTNDDNIHRILFDAHLTGENAVKESFFQEIIQNKYINKNRSNLSNTLFSLAYPGYSISTIPLIQNSDILNFHWIAFFLSPVTIKNLFLLKKPIVWTLHDQNPFTGGCHYSGGCLKYIEENCENCPQLKDDYFSIPNNIFMDKLKLFEDGNLTIVTPSYWLADCAKKSKLFKKFRVEAIPNSIETDVFFPIEKKLAKKTLGVNEDTITILFGAENGNEKRKGFHLLINAIKHCLANERLSDLNRQNKIKILCFGEPNEDLNKLTIPVFSLGYIKSDDILSTVYSASDFVVLPSIEDNLPNIILEAMGCGTPVIAFASGGMPDLIIPNLTGKLAIPFEENSLSDAILEMVFNQNDRLRMSYECRKFIETKYALRNQAENYLNLYKLLLKETKLERSTKKIDFTSEDDFKVNNNFETGEYFSKNGILKDSYEIYKSFFKLHNEHKNVIQSYSYKVGFVIVHPIKVLKKVIKAIYRRLNNKPHHKKEETKLFTPIRVLYDHQVFSLQSYGGISRYFYELMSCYHNTNLLDFNLPIKYSNNYYLKNSNFIKNKIIQFDLINKSKTFENFLTGIKFRGKRKLYKILKFFGFHKIKKDSYYINKNKKISIKLLQKDKFDVFHPTYYDEYFINHIGDKPFVLTIYDMIHELFADMFPQLRDETTERKKILARKATKIIAISENTKKDIIKLYGIEENKIKVIHLGTSLKYDENKVYPKIDIPKKYILFVGERHYYKNFCFFMHSIIPLLKHDKDLYVVCAGGGVFTKEEVYLLRNTYIEDRVIQIFFNDDILTLLYKNALAFVFPSLYEGFGIPVLEAFACKCPLILSNTSCFPEIAGDAAIYFDPANEYSIRDSVTKVIYNEELRNYLIQKGTERLKNFSWEKTARETKKVYESLMYVNDFKS